MEAYQQKTRAAAKPQTGAAAHGIDARSAVPADAAAPEGSASQSPPASAPRSLRQMRQALDDSPRVRQQAALQRALDQRSRPAAPAKKKFLKEKPSLQRKGIAINDDAGLEREADVMGARAHLGGQATLQRALPRDEKAQEDKEREEKKREEKEPVRRQGLRADAIRWDGIVIEGVPDPAACRAQANFQIIADANRWTHQPWQIHFTFHGYDIIAEVECKENREEHLFSAAVLSFHASRRDRSAPVVRPQRPITPPPERPQTPPLDRPVTPPIPRQRGDSTG